MGSLIQELVEAVHARYVGDRSGAIFSGTPGLEHRVDPDAFGLCLATADGYVYEAGDTRQLFCIQSVSKPFTYGLALADRGFDAVDARIDVEPSGESYNQISLEGTTHRPRNAMINAGALVAASLVEGDTPTDQYARLRQVLSGYAGRDLAADEDVFRTEFATGHRNRAIGHMLRHFGMIERDPDLALEVYLRACATTITCHDLALMGATLANGGTHPLTGRELLTADLTERVLSVMATCGMYDSAGEWLAEVGMSAKSGVGGGIVAVLPGQLAVAAYSPRLDEHGNSIRAFRACRRLSSDLQLHAFHVARGGRSAIRACYDVLEVPSARRRPERDRTVLEAHGHRARVYELHGDLLFAGAESVVRAMSEVADDEVEYVIADVRLVHEVSDISRRLLMRLREFLRERGCEALLVDPEGLVSDGPRSLHGDRMPVFSRRAEAIAFAEDALLARYGGGTAEDERFELADHPGLEGTDPAVVSRLREHLIARTYDDGRAIVRQGDATAGVFFLVSGSVRSTLELEDGEETLVALHSPGTTTGSAYVVTGNPHPMTLRAEGRVEVFELPRDAWEEIVRDDPELHAAALTVFMHAFHADAERGRMGLLSGRVAVR